MFRGNNPTAIGGSSVLVLGSFDGVHRGHRELLQRARLLADGQGLQAVAVTFRQHPLSVLNPAAAPSLLTTTEERAVCMERLGMDGLVELEFTRELADREPEDFIRELCAGGEVRHLVVGYNYSFGRRGRGNISLLQELSRILDFTLTVVDPVTWEGEPVSSSRIREAISRGDTLQAAHLLGRPYSMGGEIIRGKQLGRKLGFPTLNVDFPRGKAEPSAGVYTGWIRWEEGLVPAVTNIGRNPTVEEGPGIHLEAHALEPIPLTYGDRAEVLFGEKLRGEKRFSSVEELTRQVMRDRETARRWRPQLEAIPELSGKMP